MLINHSVNNEDEISMVFAALADPTRRSILSRLSTSNATVNEIAKPFDISLPAISKHLKVLEQAGLISKSVRAQQRECHLEAARLQQATEWLDRYREFWTGNFDSLEQYVAHIKATTKE